MKDILYEDEKFRMIFEISRAGQHYFSATKLPDPVIAIEEKSVDAPRSYFVIGPRKNTCHLIPSDFIEEIYSEYSEWGMLSYFEGKWVYPFSEYEFTAINKADIEREIERQVFSLKRKFKHKFETNKTFEGYKFIVETLKPEVFFKMIEYVKSKDKNCSYCKHFVISENFYKVYPVRIAKKKIENITDKFKNKEGKRVFKSECPICGADSYIVEGSEFKETTSNFPLIFTPYNFQHSLYRKCVHSERVGNKIYYYID